MIDIEKFKKFSETYKKISKEKGDLEKEFTEWLVGIDGWRDNLAKLILETSPYETYKKTVEELLEDLSGRVRDIEFRGDEIRFRTELFNDSHTTWVYVGFFDIEELWCPKNNPASVIIAETSLVRKLGRISDIKESIKHLGDDIEYLKNNIKKEEEEIKHLRSWIDRYKNKED